MKKLLPLLFTSIALATDPLTIHSEKAYVISSFEEKDFFTVYSTEGTPLWEASFTSQVVSWKMDTTQVLIFSKARAGKVYFLSSFDLQTGELKWERPIFAPDPASDPLAENSQK